MSLQVTPASAPFPGATTQTQASVPAILGLPGIARVPDLIRDSTHRLETYSPDLKADLNSSLFTDYGNLTFDSQKIETNSRIVGDACKAIINTGAIPFFFARDSRYTSSAIRATADRHPEVTVLHLGASPNLLEKFEDSKWHARTAIKRTLDRLPIQQIKHFGTRCGTKEEFDLMTQGKTQVSSKELPKIAKKGLYLSLHLSLFAPYTAPGVNLPEPGGLNWNKFTKVLARIPWKRVKACDLVGLEPSGDHTGISQLLAAKAAREIIISLCQVSSDEQK